MATMTHSPRVPDELEERIERAVIYPDGSAQNPYADYARLRAIAPVYQVRTGTWVITGYKEYTQLVRDKRISRAAAARTEMGDITKQPEELHEALSGFAAMLINQDDPGHLRIRKLIRNVFLPANAQSWLPRTRAIAKDAVDQVMGLERFDFLEHVAYVLPETVMTDLTGIPHTDRHLWADWSRQIVRFSRATGDRAPDLARTQQAMKSIYDFMAALVDNRRAANTLDGDDIVSVLMRAEEDGDKLSRNELVGAIVMLAQAAHETVANLTGNAMFHLLQRPHLLKALHDNPALIAPAIEEMLRFESSSHNLLPRMATEDIEIGDVTIRAGEKVMFLTAAANRDPAAFSDPDEMRFDRPETERQIGFGGGPHSCLGQNLARIELTAIFEQIAERLWNYEIKEPARFITGRARGLEQLVIGPAG
jgi:cytochrome P450